VFKLKGDNMSTRIDNLEGQLTHQDIDQKIHALAEQPEKHLQKMFHQKVLENTPAYTVFHQVEKYTGLVSKGYAYPYNAHACGWTAELLLFQNMFKHKTVKHITCPEDLVEELKNNEPGVFGMSSYYLDHAFAIIKTIDQNGNPSYRVIQSFINKYTLKRYNKHYAHRFVFKNYAELEKKFLKPLFRLLITKGKFGMKDLALFSKITALSVEELLTIPHYKEKIGKEIPSSGIDLRVARTTNRQPQAKL
jgi:hypothetical protein